MLGRNQASWIVAIAMLAVGLSSVASAQLPSTDAVGGVHLAYGADASTEVRVSWTGPVGADAHLAFGTGDELDETVPAEPVVPAGSPVAVYHASATGLEPDTTYSYQAVVDQATSETYTFTTAPAPGESTEITITAFADHGTVSPANTRADGDNPMRVTELGASMEPTFHIHPGDTSYAEGDPIQWNQYLDQIEPMATKAPYMTVPGNHEREEPQGFSQYDGRFNMPSEGDGRWWSMQYGNVLVIGLASERACMAQQTSTAAPTADEADDCETSEPVEPYQPQLDFVRDTLETAAEDPTIEWRILFSHHLFWSSSVHAGAKGLKEHYMPLLDEHGVDVVVQGHDHVYERSKLLHESELTETGTIYLTNGAAGSGNYDWAGDQPQWSAVRDNEHYGVLVLEIDGDELDGRFETLDDGVIDSFSLLNVEDGGVRMAGDGPSPGDLDEDDGETDGTPAPGVLAAIAVIAGLAIALRRRRWSL